MVNKILGAIVVILIVCSFGSGAFLFSLSLQHNSLIKDYFNLVNTHDQLQKSCQEFQNEVLFKSEENYTTVTIVYHTNFSMNQQILSLSVAYEKYDSYHKKDHPFWGEHNLESAMEYITPNEPIIGQIVQSVNNITQSEEDLANSLLNLVQDKGHGLNIRYYPTIESKYPIETLVEMGGDCDTHSILYGTLMKAAGFEVLLLLSNEKLSNGLNHVAIAVHLDAPPEYSLNNFENLVFRYNGKNYYYAETTMAHWRVGDFPPQFKNLTFQIMPL